MFWKKSKITVANQPQRPVGGRAKQGGGDSAFRLVEFFVNKTLNKLYSLTFQALAAFCGYFLALRCKQECAIFANFVSRKTQEKGVAMAVAFEHIAEIGEQVSQIEEKNRVSSEHLEQISRLEKHIQNNPESATISDEITHIQCIVDKANEVTNNKKFYLLLKQVEQAISEIKKFQKTYHEPLPDKVFSDLRDNLDTHRKSVKSIKKAIELLKVKEPKDILCTVRGIENFASALEGNLEFLSYYVIHNLDKDFRELVKNVKEEGIQAAKGKGKPFVPGIKKFEERTVSSIERILALTEKAKAYVISTQSAEAKAIERIQSIDSVEWETALEPEQKINIEAMNAWLEKRGYKTQVPCEDKSSS